MLSRSLAFAIIVVGLVASGPVSGKEAAATLQNTPSRDYTARSLPRWVRWLTAARGRNSAMGSAVEQDQRQYLANSYAGDWVTTRK